MPIQTKLKIVINVLNLIIFNQFINANSEILNNEQLTNSLHALEKRVAVLEAGVTPAAIPDAPAIDIPVAPPLGLTEGPQPTEPRSRARSQEAVQQTAEQKAQAAMQAELSAAIAKRGRR